MYGRPEASVKRVPILDNPGEPRLTTAMDERELLTTARMARLTLSPEELRTLGHAVEQMLEHFARMRAVDVEGLSPTTHALLRENRLREDVATSLASADALLENAPEREERFVVIPNVL